MKRYLLAGIAALALGGTARADDVVQKSFFPYANGVPAHRFVKPGITINASNVDQAKDVIDEALYDIVKNGWYDLKVVQTESFELSPSYIAATEKNYKNVQLGGSLGQISGFVAGRPFPQEPAASDPRAGERIAWNFKYGINWGDTAAISPFYWTLKNMKDGSVERTLKVSMHFLNFMHRTKLDPMPDITPNPSGRYRAIYMRVLEPEDIANTQLLINRFEDDSKRDEAFLYLGFQRRVRKLSTGQVTDSFLGTDLMIEDIEAYNGRVSDMNWKFIGTKYTLMPYYHHNEMPLSADHAESDYKYVNFIGKGACFPDITWQLRKVYVVEATPVDPSHPISKRIFNFDAQTMFSNRTLSFDRSGKLWKTFTVGKTNPRYQLPVNADSGIGVDDSFSMVDLQAQHCTTGQFKGQVDAKLSPTEMFTVDHMRSVN